MSRDTAPREERCAVRGAGRKEGGGRARRGGGRAGSGEGRGGGERTFVSQGEGAPGPSSSASSCCDRICTAQRRARRATAKSVSDLVERRRVWSSGVGVEEFRGLGGWDGWRRFVWRGFSRRSEGQADGKQGIK
eukprot:1795421-Rhodomonas_salina.1